MNDENSNQSVSTRKPSRRKYIIATGSFLLLIFAVLIYVMLSYEPGPDPASEAIIRQEVAKQLTTDPNNPLDPNRLTDDDLAKITTLNILRKELSDIKLLEKCTNLKLLNIMNVQFPDERIPKWMKIMAKIGFIDLNKRFAIDLSPLKKLTKIQRLFISSIQISNIDSVEGMKELEIIDISDTKVSNIESISNCNKLVQLDISNTKVSDLGAIKNLSGLYSIACEKTQISDIGTFKNLINLRDIDISDTPVSEIAPLKELKNLIYIDLNNCPNITDEQVEDLQKALPELKIVR